MRKLVAVGFLAALAAGFYVGRSAGRQGLASARFAFEISSSGSFQAGPKPTPQDLRIETKATGEATLTRGADSSELELKWTPKLELTVNGKRLADQEKVLTAAGPQRAVLRLNENGQPQKIFLPGNAALPTEAAEVLSNMTKMLFLQLAWNPKLVRQARTVDFWGSAALSSAGEKWITESEPRTQSGLRGKGSFQFKLASNGLVESLTGEQTSLPGVVAALGHSETRYEIRRVTEAKSEPFTIEGLEEGVPWVVVSPQSIVRAGYREKTKGWTLERVHSEAEKLIQAKKGSMTELTPLSERLQQLLWLDSSRAPDYARLALQLGPAHPLFDELLKALSQVGDARSQQALVEVVRGTAADPRAALKAMMALAFLTNPGAEARTALEAVAASPATPQIGNSAELLLGQMAYQLRDSDSPAASAIEARFRERLAQARDAREARHALDVIGNAGLCSDLPLILRYTADPSNSAYSNALEALRFCPKPEAASALLQAFLRGGDSARTALECLEMRSERGLREPVVFDGLLRWEKEAGGKSPHGQRVLNLLESLARDDARAQKELEAFQRDSAR